MGGIAITFSGVPGDQLNSTPFRAFTEAIVAAGSFLEKDTEISAFHLSMRRPSDSVVNGGDIEERRLTSVSEAVEEAEPATSSTPIGVIALPRFTWDQVVLPPETESDIVASIRLFDVYDIVFEQYGLRAIEPYPRTVLNFFGPPGTGKTMAAHGVAHHLGREIVEISYADLASKYFGESARNIRGLFDGLSGMNVVLFIDEADSLLSRRVEDTSQPAASANNSMRTEMLACLERFKGIVIFATNLVTTYDKAMDTRVKHIEFIPPVGACAEKIWAVHLPESLPLETDVSPVRLADLFPGICGRDIKNIVVDATVASVLDGRAAVAMPDFENAHRKVLAHRQQLPNNRLTEQDMTLIEEQIASEY